jgi:hypothetical protein
MDTGNQPHSGDSFSTIALIDRDHAAQNRPGPLAWWHRIAAPPAPSVDASLYEREAYRRGKYISNTLLAMISVTVILVVLIGGFVNHNLLANLGVTLFILCVAAFFNRRKKIIISGILVVLVQDTSMMTLLLGFPNFPPYLLPVFDLLVIPELFAASLLPAYFVFFDMSLHLIYFVCALTFLFHKDAQLTALLAQPAVFVDILAKPTVVQFITAIIAFTWMRSVTHSIERATRATSIAILEKNIAEQTQIEALQKRQLEGEIREIIDVHSQVANGNFEVRVPLRQGNILWPVAGSLNNLIVRLRNSLKDTHRLRQTDEAIVRFFQARNQYSHDLIPWQPTGTSIDVLVQQHNALVQQQNTQTPPQHTSVPPQHTYRQPQSTPVQQHTTTTSPQSRLPRFPQRQKLEPH